MKVVQSRIDPRSIQPGCNADKPILEVEHFALTPTGDTHQFKSCCPVCRYGWLMVLRDPETMVIRPFDNCLLCGQRVKYIDVERMRKQDDSA